MVLKPVNVYYLPISTILKLFLEIPGVFDTIFEFQNKLLRDDTSDMINVVNGKLWHKISESFKDKIVFPLIFYFDDFEVGNPLGSHAGCYKIGVLYFTIATIPPEFSSRLENIFLALIFHSQDRVSFGNESVFNIVIEELKVLESQGIILTINGKRLKVFFSVVLITGDNLGVHSILGLVENFNALNYCRFCTTSRDDCHTQIRENKLSLRTIQDYDTHIVNKIGVKESCIWNTLGSFHVYDNITCDVMHDLFEGVCRYDMALIIQYFIKQKHFTLDMLNSRMKYFTYDPSEKNVPPGIKNEHLKNGCIVLSSSEMSCLVRNFRFLVGADCIPKGNKVWHFYLILFDIIQILLTVHFSENTLQFLKSQIEAHHKLYLELFEQKLKPKHHLLLHYPTIIERTGPPKLFSCERNEAKHKEFKTYAQNIRSRRNLPYSLALRTQEKCCHRIIAKKGLNNIIDHGIIITNDCNEFINELLKNNLDLSKFCITSWYELNGIKYSKDLVLVNKYVKEEPQMCKIVCLCINKYDNTEVFFICNRLHILEYDD